MLYCPICHQKRCVFLLLEGVQIANGLLGERAKNLSSLIRIHLLQCGFRRPQFFPAKPHQQVGALNFRGQIINTDLAFLQRFCNFLQLLVRGTVC